MKTKIFTFFFGVFLLGIIFSFPAVTFATVGTDCSYKDGGLDFEGKCDLISSPKCSTGNKGTSSQCSGGEMCCDAVMVIGPTLCSFVQESDTYNGSCKATCSQPTLPSGPSPDCTIPGEKCCDASKSPTPPATSPVVSGGLVPCGGPAQGNVLCTLCHLFQGIQNIINWGMQILTVVAVVILVAMAVVYIASAGNSSTMEIAKTGIKNTLIGFGIMLLAWVIINVVFLALPINKDFVTGNWWKISC